MVVLFFPGSPIISSVKQEQQAMRFQVSSLADELSRKLQFLHVSIDGVSDMQILQVEVKTRLSDWVEGGLETKFLLSKLKEASDSLLNYEKEAAPKGWRFHWDRYSIGGCRTCTITPPPFITPVLGMCVRVRA
jgi:hypothetical protein